MSYCGWMKSPRTRIAWLKGPIITPDANTVSQIYFRNAVLVDAQSVGWAMQGTVPQVAANGKIPPGAGPFSDANYYSLGTGNDALDFAGDFSGCLIFGDTTTGVPLSDGTYSADGWMIQRNSAVTINFYTSTAGSNGANACTIANSNYHVLYFGRAGSNQIANLDGTASGSVGAQNTPATTKIANLGRYSAAGLSFGGTIWEMWLSTTTPTAALGAALVAGVIAKMGPRT